MSREIYVRKCPKCGEEAGESALYCTECGTSLGLPTDSSGLSNLGQVSDESWCSDFNHNLLTRVVNFCPLCGKKL